MQTHTRKTQISTAKTTREKFLCEIFNEIPIKLISFAFTYKTENGECFRLVQSILSEIFFNVRQKKAQRLKRNINFARHLKQKKKTISKAINFCEVSWI